MELLLEFGSEIIRISILYSIIKEFKGCIRRLHVLLAFSLDHPPVSAQCKCGTECECPNAPHVQRSFWRGRWYVLETTSFQICCEQSKESARHLARHAETLKSVIGTKWLGETSAEPWSPRCQVVLHASQRSYVAAVGPGSERTVGSSLVRVSKNRTTRRIDLLGGDTEFLSAALPHEMTHVVLRDRFQSQALPRWADEGLAILADPAAKQSRHRIDLDKAIASRTTFPAIAILTMDEYPRPDRFGAFYGQSASLTEYLVERKGPQQFVEFVERAAEQGYDAALQQCYEIADMGELDRLWRSQLRNLRSPAHRGG